MNFTHFFGILLGIKWAQIVLGVKLLFICEISTKKLGLQPYEGGFYDLLKFSDDRNLSFAQYFWKKICKA